MCNVQCFSMELFQFGLYALILFLKCDVTKFRIPPLSYNAPSPLMCDVIYGWSLRSFSKDLLRRLDTFRCRTCHNQVNLLFLITTTIAGSIEISQLFFFSESPLVVSYRDLQIFIGTLLSQATRTFVTFWLVPMLPQNVK